MISTGTAPAFLNPGLRQGCGPTASGRCAISVDCRADSVPAFLHEGVLLGIKFTAEEDHGVVSRIPCNLTYELETLSVSYRHCLRIDEITKAA